MNPPKPKHSKEMNEPYQGMLYSKMPKKSQKQMSEEMIIMQSDRNENRTIVEQAEEIMSINIPFPASSNTSKYLQVKSQNDRKNYIRDKKSEFSKKSNSKSPKTQRI